MICEKCWADAAARVYGTGRDQYEVYRELLEERKDNPCSPQEQAGEWWDEERQCDTRLDPAPFHEITDEMLAAFFDTENDGMTVKEFRERFGETSPQSGVA